MLRVSIPSVAWSWEMIWEAGPYYERVSRHLSNARDYVILAGWQIDSRLPMPGPGGARERLRDQLIRVCEENPRLRIYFLVWDHSYLYMLERELFQARIWDRVHPRIHFVFDNRHPFGGAHHEKVVIVDGTLALCGGIDLCDRRWDTPEHRYDDPRRSLDGDRETHGPYHDLAVEVTGPVCAELQRHLHRRWRRVSSVPFPRPRAYENREGQRVHVCRTTAGIDREVERMHRALIEGATESVLIEGQYYWSESFNRLLVSRMRELSREGREFHVDLILADLRTSRSLTRHMEYYELGMLAQLRQAARETGTRLRVGFPAVPGPPGLAPKPVYVHSKLLLVDDRWLSIGSANLADRALRLDTELNLVFEARTVGERARLRAFGETERAHWAPLALREPRERERRVELRRAHPLLASSRWKPIFDPLAPWPYLVKKRIAAFARRSPGHEGVVIALAWALGAALAIALAGAGASRDEALWRAAYALVFASAWLLPIPVVLLVAVCAAQLGSAAAFRAAAAGVIAASLVGYVAARAFPAASLRLHRRALPARARETMGERTFDSTLRVTLDPRVSIRAKIALQGLYSIPFPWFALSLWAVLPGALGWIARIASGLLVSLDDAVALALALASLLVGIAHENTAARPHVQHP